MATPFIVSPNNYISFSLDLFQFFKKWRVWTKFEQRYFQYVSPLNNEETTCFPRLPFLSDSAKKI